MQFARNEQLSEKTTITWILNELIFAIDPGIIRRIFSVFDLETLLIRACLVKLSTQHIQMHLWEVSPMRLNKSSAM